MNVIKPSRIRAFAQKHARAAACLAIWLKKAQAAEWDSFQEVRATFNSVDQVLVKSGKAPLFSILAAIISGLSAQFIMIAKTFTC